MYIISGERSVTGALLSDTVNVISLLTTSDKRDLCDSLLENHPALSDTETLMLSPGEFSGISEEQTPQGIALVVEKPDTIFNPHEHPGFLPLYLDRVRDPGNLGTIMRTVLWFGGKTVFLSPCSADPFQGKVVRSSAGSITQIKIHENCTESHLEMLKKRYGFTLVAAMASGSQSLSALNKKQGNFLMFGAESTGLKDSLIDMSDTRIRIPGSGKVESLNLAISVGCFLYHLTSKPDRNFNE